VKNNYSKTVNYGLVANIGKKGNTI